MSQSARSRAKGVFGALGVLLVLALGWLGMVNVLKADAFSKFRSGSQPIGVEVGVTLNDFEIKSYESGKLALDAHVDSMDVRRDRSQMRMVGVTGGRIYSKDGVFEFDGDEAVYHYYLKRLTSEARSHVKSDDIELTSHRFTYDKESHTLDVRGQVVGTVAGGRVQADDLVYDTVTKSTSATNVTWKGELSDVVGQQKKVWEIHGASFTSEGDVNIYTDARATDGEVIVVAKKVEYNKSTDVLVATGDVNYWGVDANVTCLEATIFRKEKRAVMTGGVRMFLKSEENKALKEEPIPELERTTPEAVKADPQGATKEQVDVLRSGDNLRKFPVKVVADAIEYWYKEGERRAIITGSPFARQDLEEGWRFIWAHEGFYDGEEETLTLKSKEGMRGARMMLSIGDDYQAADVTISTKEGDKKYSGHDVRATVYLDEDETPKAKSGGGT